MAKGTERRNRDLSLEEFKAVPAPEAWQALRAFKGGALLRDCPTFSDCHVRVREETGLWIEELAPVFQKLDAVIASAR